MEPPARHIALVGLSGSGKSTVAPMVSSRLGHGAAVDLDRVIEDMFSAPVEEIFAKEGETRFREFESDALARSLTGPPVVIATGGGCVLDASNRALLRGDDVIVVWLKGSPVELAARLRDTTEARPLLSGDPVFALQRLAEEREALYNEVADITVDVDGMDARSVVDEIERKVRRVGDG